MCIIGDVQQTSFFFFREENNKAPALVSISMRLMFCFLCILKTLVIDLKLHKDIMRFLFELAHEIGRGRNKSFILVYRSNCSESNCLMFIIILKG